MLLGKVGHRAVPPVWLVCRGIPASGRDRQAGATIPSLCMLVALSEPALDDFSDMEAAIRHSAAVTSLDLLRPQFPAWRKQMVENGFPRVPAPLCSAGVHEDMATNMFLLLMKQAMDPALRKQRANAADEHNLRNILGYMRVSMLRYRGRWKP